LRTFALVAAALVLVPCAAAKGRMSLTLGDSAPTAGRSFAIVLTMEGPVDSAAHVRVIAVAPGRSAVEVAGVLSGGFAATASDRFPADGFAIELKHAGPRTWHASAKLPRAGLWHLVVPNWGGAPGYATPPPIDRTIRVSR
jgi:hypothetical protein